MRWADLDQLGHVNNVVYADYLQEARVDLLRLQVGDTVDGLVVVNHQLEYVAPMTFDPAPVQVAVWVTEIRSASFALGYEVYRETAGERTVHLRAASVLAPFVLETGRPRRITEQERSMLARYLEPAATPAADFAAAPATAAGYPLRVRFSDLDPYGHVNNVKHFEYIQEARVALRRRLGLTGEVRMVVKRADLAYRRPILFRHEPYQVRTWVSELGTTSVVWSAEIVDGDTLLAQARHVMVFFDPETERPLAPPDDVRRRLEGSLNRGC